jgi:hypothetical protein
MLKRSIHILWLKKGRIPELDRRKQKENFNEFRSEHVTNSIWTIAASLLRTGFKPLRSRSGWYSALGVIREKDLTVWSCCCCDSDWLRLQHSFPPSFISLYRSVWLFEKCCGSEIRIDTVLLRWWWWFFVWDCDSEDFGMNIHDEHMWKFIWTFIVFLWIFWVFWV